MDERRAVKDINTIMINKKDQWGWEEVMQAKTTKEVIWMIVEAGIGP